MTLENLLELRLEESDDWYFKTKCTQCNEVNENVIHFNLVEKFDIEGSRGEANYIAKCKLCERPGNIEYCQNSLKPYTQQGQETFQTIAAFECRNIELIEFVPGNAFKAQGSEGDQDTMFDEIDLSQEPDWAGYDEENDCSVGVYEFKSQIIRSNKK